MNESEKCIEAIYKDKFGQLIALLLQRFRGLPIESAEDIVQETFAEATVRWPKQGIPENPPGWIYQAARTNPSTC